MEVVKADILVLFLILKEMFLIFFFATECNISCGHVIYGL